MLKRISIMLLSTLVVAILIQFAATQAGAFSQPDGQCTPDEEKNFECFKSAGYVVEIVPDAQGKFPKIVDGNSVFTYKFTWNCKKDKIILVDMLIPNDCTPKLEILASNPGGKLFTNSVGEPITKFGRGLTLDDTWVWDCRKYNAKLYSAQISLTVAGNNVGADHTAMFLKTAVIDESKYGKGEILAPGCGYQTALGALPAKQCLNLFENETEKISADVRRDSNGCIIEDSVTFYKSSNCTGEVISHTFLPPDPDFVYASGTGGGCPELVAVTLDSPPCVTLTLKSGRKTVVCY